MRLTNAPATLPHAASSMNNAAPKTTTSAGRTFATCSALRRHDRHVPLRIDLTGELRADDGVETTLRFRDCRTPS
jgi:hypothetical protein